MAQHDETNPAGGPSRRDFLRGAAAGAAGAGLLASCTSTTPATAAEAVVIRGATTITLRVNGQPREVVVEPRTTLLDALRDGRDTAGRPVDVTGPKRVCDRGTCGACTVLIDGETTYACSFLALDAVDHEIRTVEGLAADDKLHVIQEELVRHDGLQCGFCTSGMATSAARLLETHPAPTRQEIQQALDGHVCRCGAYPRIFEAVEAAAARLRQGG